MGISIQVKEKLKQGISGFSGRSGTSGFSGGPAGASGQSGFSGIGFAGSAGSGISGWSGFSGPSASVYTWTTRAYINLDETRIGLNSHPAIVPASAELNLALEANKTYVITGVFFTSVDDRQTQPIFTNWTYTGTVNNFKIGFSASDPASLMATFNYWVEVNKIYPVDPPVGAWQYQYSGDDANYNALVIYISGTIETQTSGTLSYCWLPYRASYPAHMRRGSYLTAETLGGAASGCSGFSGKTSPVMLGSFLGI